jgi:hypothetical protein
MSEINLAAFGWVLVHDDGIDDDGLMVVGPFVTKEDAEAAMPHFGCGHPTRVAPLLTDPDYMMSKIQSSLQRIVGRAIVEQAITDAPADRLVN